MYLSFDNKKLLKEKLLEIKNKMPHGRFTQLAAEKNLDRKTIYKVVNGIVTDPKVVAPILQILLADLEETSRQQQDLTSLLQRSK